MRVLTPCANRIIKWPSCPRVQRPDESRIALNSMFFSNVKIGNYDVTATAPGFKAAQVTGVIVQVGTTASLNITLETGEVSH
jgi:hypothetical protein